MVYNVQVRAQANWLKNNRHTIVFKRSLDITNQYFVLLAYATTAYFQWELLKNGPYTCTVNEENGRVS